MQCKAAQHRDSRDGKNKKHQTDRQRNAENVFTLDHIASLSFCSKFSKGLTQGDKKLSGAEPGNRIQVAAHVNPHRTDGSLVAQAEADGVDVFGDEEAEAG
jgi:hypothetical protein